MLTLSEENYIKSLFHLQQNTQHGVSTSALAQRLETKPSSATDMLQKLSDKGLVDYIKYKGALLSPEGYQLATHIVRKHRLWEVFLVKTLDFSWDQVHDIAEQLEHIHSPLLVEKLDAFLGHPRRDPHGDPIPDKNGYLPEVQKTLLSEHISGQESILVSVKDASDNFLKYLNQKNISLGAHIKVIALEPFDGSMTVEINDLTHYFSPTITTNLYVQSL